MPEHGLYIPDPNIIITVNEMEPSRFRSLEGRTENFTLIEVCLFNGRSYEVKKGLYQAITNNLSQSPGISVNDIVIVLYEFPMENWSVGDGLPATESAMFLNRKI